MKIRAPLCALLMFAVNSLASGNSGFEKTYDPPNRDIPDKLLGFKPKPDTYVHAIERLDGKTLYDVHYTIDRFSRRATPGENTKRNDFALLFGCSFVFGEGVNDNETLAYFLAHDLKNVRTYNYGFSAYGAQQMLARLEDGKLSQEVSEKRGVGLYFFLDDHMRRTLGTLDIVHAWSPMPYYDFVDGKLVRKADTFEEGRTVSEFLTRFDWFKKLIAWRRFKFTDGDFDLFSEILLESKKHFESQFPGSTFVVVFMDHWGGASTERLIPFLQKKGIRYLDYSSRPDLDRPIFQIPEDHHPNKLGNTTFADILVPDIKKILDELK